MGSNQSQPSQALDKKGKTLQPRRCIILLSPPSFQTSKFIQGFPSKLKYKYVSVGKLIRDEINKKTHYSKIIMQNLAKQKKINDKILQILLKNTALQGNFIIHFSPKDNDDLDTWRKFFKEVIVDLVVILKTDVKHEVSQQKTIYDKKLKEFSRDVRNVKDIFDKNVVKELDYDEQIYDSIIFYIEQGQKKKQ